MTEWTNDKWKQIVKAVVRVERKAIWDHISMPAEHGSRPATILDRLVSAAITAEAKYQPTTQIDEKKYRDDDVDQRLVDMAAHVNAADRDIRELKAHIGRLDRDKASQSTLNESICRMDELEHGPEGTWSTSVDKRLDDLAFDAGKFREENDKLEARDNQLSHRIAEYVAHDAYLVMLDDQLKVLKGRFDELATSDNRHTLQLRETEVRLNNHNERILGMEHPKDDPRDSEGLTTRTPTRYA